MEEFWDRLAEVWGWFTIKENREPATAIAQVVATLLAILAGVWAFFKFAVPRLIGGKSAVPEVSAVQPSPVVSLPTGEPLMSMPRSVFEAELEKRAAEVEAALATASEDERTRLEGQRAEIARRLADVEGALKERENRIRELEDLLAREGNEIGGDRLAEARTTLEQGDFSKADDLFSEIEAREQMAVQSAARAAYGRGEIAEEQVRWADAAEHYARSARLGQTYDSLRKALEFSWRAGDYAKAEGFGAEVISVVLSEFGDESIELANALNDHAGMLRVLGRYAEAEPLFRQALEIGAKTIGTAHPDYAIHLNNHAALLQAMGRFDEAEPLFRQAMEIDAKTIGTEHPDYATDLNNLAALLKDMGRHDEAEPLYVAALDILRAKLGPDHPTTKIVETNYARFLKQRGGSAAD